ncbi:MAG: membrane protein insertase YidC [Betaproteobacteria bacterium]|nr:membrane protein insertase YidC [Betaproteobacteria bacterium]
MDTQRIIALIVFMFSGMLLWEAWNKHNQPPLQKTATQTQAATGPSASTAASATVPSPTLATPADSANGVHAGAGKGVPGSAERVRVSTDAMLVEIDTLGGDIRQVTLLKHPARGDASKPFILMQDKAGAYFVAQSGFSGKGFPNHTNVWKANVTKADLGAGDTVEVVLTNGDNTGIAVTKTFVFRRGSYVIDVKQEVKNQSADAITPTAYYQFLRDGNPPEGESSGNMFTGVATFTGPAIYTDAKKFQKVDFSAIDKNKQEHDKVATDGWIAMVQHYFVSAWLPEDKQKREYFTRKVDDKLYWAGVFLPMSLVPPGASATQNMRLYVGPQEQENLLKLAPGLDLVVDYGWLKILAYPMFTVLSWIDKMVGNWGWTIIIFTILLKLVFFPLNQKAGKSMAHMKHLAPKVEALKARYGDDKMKMNQAMMELYKTEKVNPLGGCLPILIQMPFLIAMYWVLLGAVELRNAPWLGWITDLSVPDPYYVLPVIMGASMIIQTKLNPAPPDPVQAKVMMIMPVVFSVMFFFFPAGLVLYWTMQNILGIGQQWYINKTTAQPAQTKGSTAKS